MMWENTRCGVFFSHTMDIRRYNFRFWLRPRGKMPDYFEIDQNYEFSEFDS